MTEQPWMIAWAALVLGWVLIFLEFYLPGAVLGILGGLSVLGSIIYVGFQAETLWQALLFLVVALVGVVLTIRLAIKCIRRAKTGRGIYSQSDQEGYIATDYPKDSIGKRGLVLTDLKPGGFILVEGQKWQAISVAGYIEKGRQVKIIDGSGATLFVGEDNAHTTT